MCQGDWNNVVMYRQWNWERVFWADGWMLAKTLRGEGMGTGGETENLFITGRKHWCLSIVLLASELLTSLPKNWGFAESWRQIACSVKKNLLISIHLFMFEPDCFADLLKWLKLSFRSGLNVCITALGPMEQHLQAHTHLPPFECFALWKSKQ